MMNNPRFHKTEQISIASTISGLRRLRRGESVNFVLQLVRSCRAIPTKDSFNPDLANDRCQAACEAEAKRENRFINRLAWLVFRFRYRFRLVKS
jgi:hypothetical protein